MIQAQVQWIIEEMFLVKENEIDEERDADRRTWMPQRWIIVTYVTLSYVKL
jgi:hypothetical protein